jgi:chromosome segregation ATPase
MSDIVDRLRGNVKTNATEYVAAHREAADTIESLRAENSAQALLIASLKEELAKQEACNQDMVATYHTITQQLSDTQRQNAELMQRVESMCGALEAIKEERDRLVALDKESKAALDKFNRQLMRDNAILGARVGEANGHIDKMCEMLESADPYRSVYDLMLIIKSALSASNVSNEGDGNE